MCFGVDTVMLPSTCDVHCCTGFWHSVFLEFLVHRIVVPIIDATMDVPPHDNDSAAPAALQMDRLTPGKGRRPQSCSVRLVPTQKGGRFALREVLCEPASDASTENSVLEYVLVHFHDMNGEWLHSDMFKESHAMQDVEAVLYFFLRHKLEPDMCYRLVWHPQKRGPYPTRTGEHSEPKLREHSDLNSAQKVHRTDDRQVIITCYKTKMGSC